MQSVEALSIMLGAERLECQGRSDAEMEMRLGPAKGKNSATTHGPWLVTRDELDPFRAGAGYDLEKDWPLRCEDHPDTLRSAASLQALQGDPDDHAG